MSSTIKRLPEGPPGRPRRTLLPLRWVSGFWVANTINYAGGFLPDVQLQPLAGRADTDDLKDEEAAQEDGGGSLRNDRDDDFRPVPVLHEDAE